MLVNKMKRCRSSMPAALGSEAGDSIKALNDARLDAERGVFMFDGVISLLQSQEQSSEAGRTCGVCNRLFDGARSLLQCTKQLQCKRESVKRMRDGEAAAILHNCLSAMKDLGHDLAKPGNSQTVDTNSSSPRKAFFKRTGELSEWRQQKVDCMSNMTCFACKRMFTKGEFSEFLKRVDHRAASLEKELHVHAKFCPSEFSPTQYQTFLHQQKEQLLPAPSAPSNINGSVNNNPAVPGPSNNNKKKIRLYHRKVNHIESNHSNGNKKVISI